MRKARNVISSRFPMGVATRYRTGGMRLGVETCSLEEKAVTNSSELDTPDDAPLYIRWSPDRSPYAIELKLELVAKITGELAPAERAGSEIAGVLVGSFPDGNMPTLRVEEIEIIPAGTVNGPINLADPELQARYSEIRWKLRRSGRAAVGLFRSHLRPGPLQPAA